MLIDRILKALTFRREVYAEVENDTSFTATAWGIVAVLAVLNQLFSSTGRPAGDMAIATVLGAGAEVFSFAVGAFVIAWVGKAMFRAEVNFDEMVRTLGLAYVWRALGVVGALVGVVPLLGLIVLPLICVGVLLSIAAWFVATQEALDLDTGQTIITVIVGWVAVAVVSFLVTSILAAIGFSVTSITSAAGG